MKHHRDCGPGQRSLVSEGREDRVGIFTAATFALAYGLGLRVGEICRLQVGDIDFDRAVLTIKQSKYSKTRLLPLGPKLAQRLYEFVAECDKSW